MATVDDKVVAMSFESSKFESGVNSVISALDKLKAALKFPEAGKGLDSINSSASKVDLSHIGKAVDDIKGKFSAVSVAAIAAFTTVTLKAASAATQVIKSFTLQPILDGFKEYETNLNAIQTVLSNTKAAGTTLDDVNKALQDLNTYSDKTIYNFSQMAKNIGTFTAAGVDLKTSTESIKGIANLAALSGSNADQASTAMYQLSQAISAGRVSLQDWNSVVNAGMGGTVFQRALAQTAEQMGTLKDGSVKLSGAMKNVTIDGQSFRQSLSAGPGKDSWLTSDVLTKTLSQFSGDLTDAQLKAEGFNDAEIKAIQTQAKMALNAATQVKTFSQLLDTTKEAIGSGWAQTWQIIFGDFGEARTLFTGISKALNGWISDSSNARNKVLADWKALGGRTILLDGISQAFKAIGAVLGTVKDAFRDIFPAKTGKDLLDLTVKFHAFAEAMQPSPETLDKLQRTFKGLFAVLDIGKQIVSGIFSVIGDLFGAIGKGSGGFLDITAAIGDFLVKLDDAIKKGDGLTTFFTGLGSVLAAPIRLLGQLRSAIANIFTGGDANASGGFADALVNSMTKGLNAVVDLFKNLGPAIAKAISSINFNTVFLALNTGLIAGIFVVIKKFLGHGFADALGGIGGGILKNISGSFAALTGSLKALQTNIQAGTLQKIAIAVALLAASVLALSLIDPKKLNSALTAMTVGFGELLGAMKILTTISSTAGFVKVPVIAASLVILAAAVDLLVLAVVGLSMLNWEQLAKGLIGVGALLASLSIAAGPLSKNSAGMISAGVGITAMAVGIKILASAIKDFGGMSWATIGKGIGAVAGALVILGLAARAFPPGMVVIGAGLIAVSIGLKLLGSAVSQFGGMDWSTIGKGILGIAGAMVIIAGAMQIMPKGMVLQAAALVGVAFALQLIARAVTTFGGMSITEIAKGLGTLAGSLVILAAAMMIMQGSIAGAAALTIAAAGLALLVPPLIALGQQSVGTIAKALIGLALAFAILGAAAILLEPAAPALLAFGVALIAIGAALALAGAGIALIGLGLSSIAVAGPTAVSILIHALTDLAAAGPKLVVSLADSLLSLIDRLAEIAPKFVDAIVKILNSLIDAIIIMAPKIVEAFGVILQNVLLLLRSNFPMFIQTGLDMLIALLNGIKNNIGQVVSTVVTVVITLLSAIAGQLGRIITAGAEILQAVVSGILSGIGSVISSAVNIVTRFIQSIASNIGRIVSAGVSIVTNLIEGIASLYSRIISAGLTAMTHFITGIGNKAGDLIKAGTSAAGKFINALVSGVLQLVDEGARAVIRFLNGIADAINKYEPQMIAAGANIGKAIVTGMISGVGALAGQLLAKVKSLISSLPGAAKKLLHISSPSTIFAEIGENMMLGLILGIDKNADAVNSSIEDATNGMIATMADTATAVSDSLASLVDTEPVITPVLDLSQLESDAQQIGGIFNVVPITAATSSGQATAISASQSAQTPSDEIPGTPGSPSFMFEQNNYSPESLSEVEIYRQTKNQLAQVKVALDMV